MLIYKFGQHSIQTFVSAQLQTQLKTQIGMIFWGG